jgi:hypothetical protein
MSSKNVSHTVCLVSIISLKTGYDDVSITITINRIKNFITKKVTKKVKKVENGLRWISPLVIMLFKKRK